jgi:hypothetical protein
MEQLFVISFLVTAIFCIMKFLEAKFLEKEMKPLKYFVRDTLMVFMSSIVGAFIFFNLQGSLMDMMGVITDNKSLNLATTQIFTDAPGF